MLPAQKRIAALGLAMALAAGAYAAAKLASASIVAYVVEETLIQKSPPGIDPVWVRRRFHNLLSRVSSRAVRLERLMEIAQVLEKSQRLSPADVERLLGGRE